MKTMKLSLTPGRAMGLVPDSTFQSIQEAGMKEMRACIELGERVLKNLPPRKHPNAPAAAVEAVGLQQGEFDIVCEAMRAGAAADFLARYTSRMTPAQFGALVEQRERFGSNASRRGASPIVAAPDVRADVGSSRADSPAAILNRYRSMAAGPERTAFYEKHSATLWAESKKRK